MHKFLELICVKSNLVVEHMVMCWPCSSNLSSMSTKIEIVVVLVTDVAVNYCSWKNIIRAFGLEELRVVVYLSYDQCKLGILLLIQELACLHHLIQFNIKNLVKLRFTDTIPENDNVIRFLSRT